MGVIETVFGFAGNLAFMLFFFIVALSIIIAIHEYGHYIVGRWCGIHADVFSIGFGTPLISGTDKHGTVWQIAAIPFGGYVKFRGDANAASGQDVETMRLMSAPDLRSTMHGAPIWARAATVAAGPVFNFIFSILLFALLFLVQGRPTDTLLIDEMVAFPQDFSIQEGDDIIAVQGIPVQDITSFGQAAASVPHDLTAVQYTVLRGGQKLEVTGPQPVPAVATSVSPQSAAIVAGLKKGDVIVSANDVPTPSFTALQNVVVNAAGAPVVFQVYRSGQTLQFEIAPKRTDYPLADGGFETRWLIGVSGGLFFQTGYESVPVSQAFGAAVDRTVFIVTQTFSAISHMVRGDISTCNLSGPISIAQTSGQVATLGVMTFLTFVAVISTAVGLMNLLPIPMLDGGHLVFYAYEAVFRRPMNPRVLEIAFTIGAVIVGAFMIFALLNDIACP